MLILVHLFVFEVIEAAGCILRRISQETGLLLPGSTLSIGFQMESCACFAL